MTEVFAIRILEEWEFNSIKDRIMLAIPYAAREKVKKHKLPIDFQRSLLGELMIRSMILKFNGTPIDTADIGVSEKGKPFLNGTAGFCFNISHSGEWIVMAVSDKEVGVDIEKIKQANFKVAERFFSSDEFQELSSMAENKKNNFFYSLWTAKESYLKYLGKGLTMALSSFSITGIGGTMRLNHPDLNADNVFFHQYVLPENHIVSLCSPENSFSNEITILKVDDLFNNIRNGQRE